MGRVNNIKYWKYTKNLLALVGVLLWPGYSFGSTQAREEFYKLPDVRVRSRYRLLRPEKGEFFGETIRISSAPSSWQEVLRTAPSITVKSAGGEGAEPQFLIRGHDAHQSRYFLEGFPLTDSEFNSFNVSILPMESIAAMDFHPEGIPVRFLSEGLGGGINFRLREPEERNQVGVRIGSYSSYKVFGGGHFTRTHFHLEYRGAKDDFSYFDNNGTG